MAKGFVFLDTRYELKFDSITGTLEYIKHFFSTRFLTERVHIVYYACSWVAENMN